MLKITLDSLIENSAFRSVNFWMLAGSALGSAYFFFKEKERWDVEKHAQYFGDGVITQIFWTSFWPESIKAGLSRQLAFEELNVGSVAEVFQKLRDGDPGLQLENRVLSRIKLEGLRKFSLNSREEAR